MLDTSKYTSVCVYKPYTKYKYSNYVCGMQYEHLVITKLVQQMMVMLEHWNTDTPAYEMITDFFTQWYHQLQCSEIGTPSIALKDTLQRFMSKSVRLEYLC